MTDVVGRLGIALAGRYTIERELGRGGMATVYLAEDRKHHRHVAIKVLKPELAAALGPERFLREIELVAGLTHPHILPLYDSGGAGGFLYYVMPYVEGESLRDRLNRERELSLEDALRITREVADALSCAHRHAVVHRDIKPENILFQTGHAVVTDFGIARAITAVAGGTLTETGIAIGTPGYMSPEQATGERGLDARSDLYSLGCLLYEMLAGEPPYTGPTARAVVAKCLIDPVPSIRRVRDSIPAHVDAVLTRALAKVPADRFATAAEFAEALVTTPQVAAPVSKASIAVLPFANLSADSDNEYFSDGITQDIITRLSQIGALQVVSRTSVMRYKHTTRSLRDIAGELGVASVLEGSVRCAGDRLRITAQLIDARTDRPLWAQTFDRNMTDVFAVQAEVAESIANALGTWLSPTERAAVGRRPTDDLEAYNLCLLGRHFWNRWTEKDFTKSVEHFQSAIERDPAYALAHFGLGLAWTTLALGYFTLRPLDVYPKARRAITRALELDPEMAEAHAWLADLDYWFEFDWRRAEPRFERALSLDPGCSMAHDLYGCFLTALHRHADARVQYERACALEPLSGYIIANAALGAYRARDYTRAIELFQREIALDPNLPMGHALMALVHVQQAGRAEALAESSEGLRLGGGAPPWEAIHGYVCAACGEQAEARRVLGELETRRAAENVWLFMLGMAYGKLGERDLAFARLQEACRERGGWVTWLGVEPGLDDLRTDPRFPALLQGIGLTS